MRIEQPIVAVTRHLVITMVRELEAVRSIASAVGYQAFFNRQFGNLLRSMSWSTARGPMPARLLITAGDHVGRLDTRQHRHKPMLTSCPASFVDLATKHFGAKSSG